MDLDKFKELLTIQKLDLDEELIRQPGLMFEVSEAYVEAAGERDTLKENLATVDAKLDAEIRNDLTANGLKTTEAIVSNMIQTSPSHKEAFDAYLGAKKNADLLNALRDSFEQRYKMLESLAKLAVANYFETSSVSGAETYKLQREKLANARTK